MKAARVTETPEGLRFNLAKAIFRAAHEAHAKMDPSYFASQNEPLIVEGRKALTEGRNDDAYNLFDAFLKKNPIDPLALHGKAVACYNKDAYGEALQVLGQLRETHMYRPEAEFLLMIIKFDMKHQGEGKTYYDSDIWSHYKRIWDDFATLVLPEAAREGRLEEWQAALKKLGLDLPLSALQYMAAFGELQWMTHTKKLDTWDRTAQFCEEIIPLFEKDMHLPREMAEELSWAVELWKVLMGYSAEVAAELALKRMYGENNVIGCAASDKKPESNIIGRRGMPLTPDFLVRDKDMQWNFVEVKRGSLSPEQFANVAKRYVNSTFTVDEEELKVKRGIIIADVYAGTSTKEAHDAAARLTLRLLPKAVHHFHPSKISALLHGENFEAAEILLKNDAALSAELKEMGLNGLSEINALLDHNRNFFGFTQYQIIRLVEGREPVRFSQRLFEGELRHKAIQNSPVKYLVTDAASLKEHVKSVLSSTFELRSAFTPIMDGLRVTEKEAAILFAEEAILLGNDIPLALRKSLSHEDVFSIILDLRNRVESRDVLFRHVEVGFNLPDIEEAKDLVVTAETEEAIKLIRAARAKGEQVIMKGRPEAVQEIVAATLAVEFLKEGKYTGRKELVNALLKIPGSNKRLINRVLGKMDEATAKVRKAYRSGKTIDLRPFPRFAQGAGLVAFILEFQRGVEGPNKLGEFILARVKMHQVFLAAMQSAFKRAKAEEVNLEERPKAAEGLATGPGRTLVEGLKGMGTTPSGNQANEKLLALVEAELEGVPRLTPEKFDDIARKATTQLGFDGAEARLRVAVQVIISGKALPKRTLKDFGSAGADQIGAAVRLMLNGHQRNLARVLTIGFRLPSLRAGRRLADRLGRMGEENATPETPISENLPPLQR